jgi:hypothetical protein
MEEQRTGNRGAKDTNSRIEPSKRDNRQGTEDGGTGKKAVRTLTGPGRGRETRSRAMRTEDLANNQFSRLLSQRVINFRARSANK